MDTTKARRKNDGLLCYNHGMESTNSTAQKIKSLFKNSYRVTEMVWAERKFLIIGTLSIVIATSLLPFVRSFINGQLLNKLVAAFGTNHFDSNLIKLLALLLSTEAAQSLFFALQNYQNLMFWHYIEEKFDTTMLKKKAEVDVASYEDPKLHSLMQKINEAGAWRLMNSSERQFYLLQNIVELGVATVILGRQAWWLAPIILIGNIPELITELKYGQQKWSITNLESEERKKYWLLENHFRHLPWLIEVKLLGLAKKFTDTITELYTSFKANSKANERRRLWLTLATSAISQISLGLITIYFILEVVKGNLNIGTFTFLLGSIGSLRSAMSSTFRNLARQYEDNLFVKDIFDFLDLSPALSKSANPTQLKNKTPEIIFKNVSFKYPGKDAWVLKNINLEIKPGEKVAMVGINGAGKTTLVKLLCRFYDPVEGQILIDGKDLKEIEKESWYSSLGILFQDYATYNFKIKDAIAIGKITEKENLNKIRLAAEQSEAMKFIEEFPDKLKQQLGREFPGGTEPSQGQWQKLALARIFYRNANVWVLDEPTASIDAESEAKIFEKLEKLPKDKTVILISHRFSTVRNADKIIVLKDGTISEQGTHTELLKNKQDYARLFHMQAKGYE